MKIKLFCCALIICTIVYARPENKKNEQDAVLGVIKRLVDDKANLFRIEFLPKVDKDFFELESLDDEVTLRGTTGVEIISALNWYLKYFCNNHISWCGKNIRLPQTLPLIKEKIHIASPYKYRYYLNYCTYSYTIAFWDWDRWEKEIDWMALNGINMPLAIVGEEAVWQDVYQEIGLSNDDLKSFFVGPAYFGWGWMGNIDGWGGPLPQSWIDSHRELQKKILGRMRALGMKPVLPAFTGHVPYALLNKFPNAKIQKMKGWENFEGTYILDPLDPLFKEIGKKFIQKQNEVYGTDHLYSADTFNEMDPLSTDTQYLANVSKAVSQSMVTADSLAVNVMQSWLFLHEKFWTQERINAYLEAVPNERMIILDLFATGEPQWKRTEAFCGKPWIWCMLHNWGGKHGMYGRTNAIAHELPDLKKNSSSGNIIGIGLTPEGLLTNPYIYDLMSEMTWHSEPIDISDWTMKYIHRRYGNKSLKAEEAWKILIRTLYDCNDTRHGPQGAHYCMRPTLEFSRGSFVRSEIFYNPDDIKKALKLLMEASDEIGNSDGYNYDLVDLTRQCMSDLSLEMHKQMESAFNTKNYAEYKRISGKWLDAIIDLDSLLSTRKEFLLGNWIEQSKKYATNENESSLYEWNARNLITLWGDRNSGLHDYAQKQWAGMMKTFYYPRWELLINQGRNCLISGAEFNKDDFKQKVVNFEVSWTKQRNKFTTQPVGNSISEVKRIFNKYIISGEFK